MLPESGWLIRIDWTQVRRRPVFSISIASVSVLPLHCTTCILSYSQKQFCGAESEYLWTRNQPTVSAKRKAISLNLKCDSVEIASKAFRNHFQNTKHFNCVMRISKIKSVRWLSKNRGPFGFWGIRRLLHFSDVRLSGAAFLLSPACGNRP